MDLLDILRACLKRWYVCLPVVLLTAWMAVAQYQAAAPQYTATTSALVVPSRELIIARGAQGMGGKPVTTPFNVSGGSSSLAGMLSAALNTSSVRKQLMPQGGVLLSSERDAVADGELVSVTAVANSEERAAKAVEVLGPGINQVLANLQLTAGAPEGELFIAVPGGPVDPPVLDYPDRLRGVVGVSLAGALLAVVLSVVTQSVTSGRSRSRRRSDAAARTPAPRRPVAYENGHAEASPAVHDEWWNARSRHSDEIDVRDRGSSRSYPSA